MVVRWYLMHIVCVGDLRHNTYIHQVCQEVAIRERNISHFGQAHAFTRDISHTLILDVIYRRVREHQ
jgi:hypothetical protein